MLGRTGHEVLGSARRPPAQPLALAQQPLPPFSPLAPSSGRVSAPPQVAAVTGEVSLSGRRKAAVKKAFKRLDHLGRGSVALEDALQTLSGSTAFGSMAQQEIRSGLERVSIQGPDGRSMVTFAAFCSYYQSVSPGYAHDGDFEQFLEAQWGSTDVSDILASMQRQFARVGLAQVFRDQGSQAGALVNLSPEEFKASLKRAGVQVRPDDLQRLFGAFAAPGGGVRLHDFKEQIVAPRPETPMQTRDLVLPPVGGSPPASSGGGLPPPSVGSPTAPLQPPPGRPGSAPGHPFHSQAAASTSAPAAAGGQPSGPPPSDADLDGMLQKMESELHHLRKKTGSNGPAAPKAAAAASSAAPGAGGGSAAAAPEQSLPEADGPVNDADLDATLSRMEAHIHHIKAHKAQKPAEPAPAPPPVDMPHWEHHKYGHHEIKAPEWKPESQITDMYGHQHAASEYHYSNFGAGAHGHHLAHFHLNDYGSLAHHSFQQQEYHRQQYGAAGHHGHWVPHLHGIGTQGHHGEHEYKKDDYHSQSYGKEGHHSHWVPHLHGLGDAHGKPGAATS